MPQVLRTCLPFTGWHLYGTVLAHLITRRTGSAVHDLDYLDDVQ